MERHLVTGITISALLLSTGCVAADPRPGSTRDIPSQAAPQSPAAPVAEGLRDKETKDKDKRGNTPPGTDRTGGGPASGAIVDPAGAVTKDPVPRER